MNVIGPFPYNCPPGFKWIPRWTLEPTYLPETSQTIQNKSFEELFLDKIKPMKKSPQKKRSRVNLSATIVSDENLLQQLKEKESEKNEKKEKRKVAPSEKEEEEEEEEEEIVEDSEEEILEETEESEDEDENVISAPRDLEQAIPILHQCWNTLQPPQEEAVLKNCHYAVIYIDPKKKQSMFIGKVQHRWLHDEQGTVHACTFDFLKPKIVNLDDDILEKYEKDGTDEDIIPIHQIIAGPLKVINLSNQSYRSRRKVEIPEYQAVRKLYDFLKKLDLFRKSMTAICVQKKLIHN